MNADIRMGIVFALAAMGFLLFLIETFGRPFVGTIIIGCLGFFGLAAWMRFRIDCLKRESEIKANHFHKSIKPLPSGMVLYDPYAAQLVHDDSLQSLETPIETTPTGAEPVDKKPVIREEKRQGGNGVGEWPMEEKIRLMDEFGVSKNAICRAAFGSKSGENMAAIDRVLNG